MNAPLDPAHSPVGPVPDGHYEVDTTRSTVRFRATSFGLIPVRGHMPIAAGAVDVVDGRLRGAGQIAADAIDTGLSARDWHLRSSHYLATADHPRIHVELDAVPVDEAAPTCTVTVRGREHPVAVSVQQMTLDDGGLRIALSTALDRTPYPMLPPVAGVSRVVDLDVELVATPTA